MAIKIKNKRMKPLRLLFFAVATFISCLVSGQAKLGVTIDSFPTQITLADTAVQHYNLYIHNYGDSIFNDSETLYYTVNGTLFLADTPGQGLYLPPESLSLAPHDSVLRQLTVKFNLPSFQTIGSSAVVIWPKANHTATYDSLFYAIEVTLTAGTTPVSASKLEVYINQQQLWVNADAENYVKRVRIYDIEGQLIFEQGLFSSLVIPMNKYSSGCYVAEVILNDNSRRVFKLAKISDR